MSSSKICNIFHRSWTSVSHYLKLKEKDSWPVLICYAINIITLDIYPTQSESKKSNWAEWIEKVQYIWRQGEEFREELLWEAIFILHIEFVRVCFCLRKSWLLDSHPNSSPAACCIPDNLQAYLGVFKQLPSWGDEKFDAFNTTIKSYSTD